MQQQRLLKNMGAHTVVLDLLQIPYEKVSRVHNSQFNDFLLHSVCNIVTGCLPDSLIIFYFPGAMFSQSDDKMNDIMTLAHTFLQNFCKGNHQNQVLLHKQLNLFLTPGVCRHDYAPLFLMLAYLWVPSF